MSPLSDTLHTFSATICGEACESAAYAGMGEAPAQSAAGR